MNSLRGKIEHEIREYEDMANRIKNGILRSLKDICAICEEYAETDSKEWSGIDDLMEWKLNKLNTCKETYYRAIKEIKFMKYLLEEGDE